MAQLILDWLNEEVRLSKRIISLDDDFRDGYLLGELMYKYNQQSNFNDFSMKGNPSAKITNFCLLEPSMRQIGVNFNAKIAFDVMHAANGTAKDLVYEMRTILEGIRRRSGRAIADDNENSLFNSGRIITVLRSGTPLFDKTMLTSFEISMRAMMENPNDVLLQPITRKFDKKKNDFCQSISKSQIREMNTMQTEFTKMKDLQKKSRIHNKEFETAVDMINQEQWKKNQQVAHERRTKEDRFIQTAAQRKEFLRAATKNATRDNVISSIDEFESQLASEFHRDDTNLKKSVGKALKKMVFEEPGSKFLDTTFLDKAVLQSGMLISKKMQKEKMEDKVSKESNKEKRRRRFLGEREMSHKIALKEAANEEIINQLLNESQSEMFESQYLSRVVVQKDLVVENRINRDQLIVDLDEIEYRRTAIWKEEEAVREIEWITNHRIASQKDKLQCLHDARDAANNECDRALTFTTINRMKNLQKWVESCYQTGLYEVPDTIPQQFQISDLQSFPNEVVKNDIIGMAKNSEIEKKNNIDINTMNSSPSLPFSQNSLPSIFWDDAKLILDSSLEIPIPLPDIQNDFMFNLIPFTYSEKVSHTDANWLFKLPFHSHNIMPSIDPLLSLAAENHGIVTDENNFIGMNVGIIDSEEFDVERGSGVEERGGESRGGGGGISVGTLGTKKSKGVKFHDADYNEIEAALNALDSCDASTVHMGTGTIGTGTGTCSESESRTGIMGTGTYTFSVLGNYSLLDSKMSTLNTPIPGPISGIGHAGGGKSGNANGECNTKAVWGTDPIKDLSEYLAITDYNQFVKQIASTDISGYDLPPLIPSPGVSLSTQGILKGAKGSGTGTGSSISSIDICVDDNLDLSNIVNAPNWLVSTPSKYILGGVIVAVRAAADLVQDDVITLPGDLNIPSLDVDCIQSSGGGIGGGAGSNSGKTGFSNDTYHDNINNTDVTYNSNDIQHSISLGNEKGNSYGYGNGNSNDESSMRSDEESVGQSMMENILRKESVTIDYLGNKGLNKNSIDMIDLELDIDDNGIPIFNVRLAVCGVSELSRRAVSEAVHMESQGSIRIIRLDSLVDKAIELGEHLRSAASVSNSSASLPLFIPVPEEGSALMDCNIENDLIASGRDDNNDNADNDRGDYMDGHHFEDMVNKNNMGGRASDSIHDVWNEDERRVNAEDVEEEEVAGNEREYDRHQLADRALSLVLSGKCISDDVYVSLIVQALKDLGQERRERRNERKQQQLIKFTEIQNMAVRSDGSQYENENENQNEIMNKIDTKDRNIVGDGIASDEASDPGKMEEIQGFILEDFPTTKQQAVLLVQALSGINYESRMPQLSDLASPYAPVMPDEDQSHDISLCGLDSVLFLESNFSNIQNVQSSLAEIFTARINLDTNEMVYLPTVIDVNTVRTVENLEEVRGPSTSTHTAVIDMALKEFCVQDLRKFCKKIGIFKEHVLVVDEVLDEGIRAAARMLYVRKEEGGFYGNLGHEKGHIPSALELQVDVEFEVRTVSSTNDIVVGENLLLNQYGENACIPPLPLSLPLPIPLLSATDPTQQTKHKNGEKDRKLSVVLPASVYTTLPKELATALKDLWSLAEEQSIETGRTFFNSLRDIRYQMIQRRRATYDSYRLLQTKLDNRQEIYDDFVINFNSVDNDFRFDKECASELYLRSLELRENLLNICDTKKKEIDIYIARAAVDGILNLFIHTTELEATALLQSEYNRFIVSLHLLFDYTKSIATYDKSKKILNVLEETLPSTYSDSIGNLNSVSVVKNERRTSVASAAPPNSINLINKKNKNNGLEKDNTIKKGGTNLNDNLPDPFRVPIPAVSLPLGIMLDIPKFSILSDPVEEDMKSVVPTKSVKGKSDVRSHVCT